jgi:hypothetical protein
LKRRVKYNEGFCPVLLKFTRDLFDILENQRGVLLGYPEKAKNRGRVWEKTAMRVD